jgi:hypothetical protein
MTATNARRAVTANENPATRLYIPIHEHNAPCLGCGKHARSLFMGVCQRCELKAYFTIAAHGHYLCWIPAEEIVEIDGRARPNLTPDNPAFASKKWWVKVG